MAAEEVAEGVEFADLPFGCGGQVGLDDGELGQALQGAPASSGAALGDLDGPDRPLGFVVGEDVEVGAGGEAQDHVLIPLEAAGDGAGCPGGGGVPGQVRPPPVPGAGQVHPPQPAGGAGVSSPQSAPHTRPEPLLNSYDSDVPALRT
nr:hypothetical protein [Trebonia sp.]